MLKSNFKTNDAALFRIHKDYENLLQMIYQIFGTYYEDNCADELRYDPVLLAVLDYQTYGYHLFLCYDGLTGDLIRAQLRDGTDYCSKDATTFIVTNMEEMEP